MAEELKERKDMDPAFQWDLTSLYKDDEAWEAAFGQLAQKVDAVAAFDGKIAQTDGDGGAAAKCIRALMETETELDLLLSDLFSYANLRRSEDTRASQAQIMYARIYAKFVEAVTRTAFIQPQILSLSEETLRAAMEKEDLAPYRFTMEKLLRQKPHTLSEKEEALLARFGEVLAAPDGAKLGATSLMFHRPARMPKRRVWIDGHRRTIVDGQPFFPLGMFSGSKNRFAEYVKGPFNTFMPYEPLDAVEMDFFHTNGIKVIYSVKDVYAAMAEKAPSCVTSAEAENAYVQAKVDAFRMHPALLAWYVNDERTLELFKPLRARQDLLEG